MNHFTTPQMNKMTDKTCSPRLSHGASPGDGVLLLQQLGDFPLSNAFSIKAAKIYEIMKIYENSLKVKAA